MRVRFRDFTLKRVSAVYIKDRGWIGLLKTNLALARSYVAQQRQNLHIYDSSSLTSNKSNTELIVLEDDCTFYRSRADFVARWPKYLSFLRAHQDAWDMFLGGSYYVKPVRLVSEDPCIVECRYGVALHFVVHSKNSIKAILDLGDGNSCPRGTLDNYLGTTLSRIWVPFPMLCSQELIDSDIDPEGTHLEKARVEMNKAHDVLEAFVYANKR